MLLLLTKPGSDYPYPIAELSGPFDLVRVDEPPAVRGTEQTLAYGTGAALAYESVTHVSWMGDDADFNPRWLIELEALILRRPEARAWSVYRSAYEAIHKTLREDGDDVLVRSLCGHGMTFSRQEWTDWGINWEQGRSWPSPVPGDTLDLHHTWARPGERWATRRSYVEHTGVVGLHCQPGIPEHARDFVR
jgi:hypothetical protein